MKEDVEQAKKEILARIAEKIAINKKTEALYASCIVNHSNGHSSHGHQAHGNGGRHHSGAH